MMYSPSAFVESDLRALDALAAQDSFITLITIADGAPQASHLPVLYHRDGGQVVLTGHVARPNPQARHTGPALAIFHGPDCYISPAWYPDEQAQARVPTWNYAVAHISGEMTLFDDTDALATLVSTLTDKYETSVDSHWRFQPDRPDHRNQLRGIVGFRLKAERIQLKFKLNQNHPLANRSTVIEQLEMRGDASGQEIAAMMRERIATPVAEDY